MPNRSILFMVLLTAAAALCAQEDGPLPWRWFFVQQNPRDAKTVTAIKGLVDTAAAHGLNGMVLSGGLDALDRWKPEQLDQLKDLRDYCKVKGIEIIPCIFSVGYGGGALGFDPNLAAALPVTMPLRIDNGRAVPVTTDADAIRNGDMESSAGGRLADYRFHDQPGKITFIDTDVKVSGKASLRFQDFRNSPHGHGRIMQEVTVKPGYAYRLELMLKTEDLQPSGIFQFLVLRNDDKHATVASTRPPIKPTMDWQTMHFDFINFADETLLVYVGVWKAVSGKFWIDDMSLKEQGSLAGIVRRKGTPLTLTNADGTVTYTEGRDFAEIRNDARLEAITILDRNAIKDGDELRLNCYKAPFIGHGWGRQISLCMSNPALFEYYERQAKLMMEIVPSTRVLLSMDEIRNGGGCLTCRQSGRSMAEILGACVTRQHDILKAVNPAIEVLVWSDMFDPDHNAHDNYYGVVGDFTGSYKYIPKDIIIACWWFKNHKQSLGFFAGEGFRTFGASYYDADDLANPAAWLAALKETKGAAGIMYTTWQKKYTLLAPFGDLVSGK